jgi:ammonia channel protein AmtB
LASEWAPDGFLMLAGDLDFAGGNVVHICSGCSGLAASLIGAPLACITAALPQTHSSLILFVDVIQLVWTDRLVCTRTISEEF